MRKKNIFRLCPPPSHHVEHRELEIVEARARSRSRSRGRHTCVPACARGGCDSSCGRGRKRTSPVSRGRKQRVGVGIDISTREHTPAVSGNCVASRSSLTPLRAPFYVFLPSFCRSRTPWDGARFSRAELGSGPPSRSFKFASEKRLLLYPAYMIKLRLAFVLLFQERYRQVDELNRAVNTRIEDNDE